MNTITDADRHALDPVRVFSASAQVRWTGFGGETAVVVDGAVCFVVMGDAVWTAHARHVNDAVKSANDTRDSERAVAAWMTRV